MAIGNKIKYLALTLAVITLTACDTTPDKENSNSAADAIAAAKSANKRASDEKYEWRDTGLLIKKAEKALASGNAKRAMSLANKARRQAENAVKQKYNELKRLNHMLSGEAQVIQTSESEAAGYLVVKGDSLWDISAKSDIYGNPYQWPLIYKHNRDKIKDADLIFPGQQFAIESNISDEIVSVAVLHAKSRGRWSLNSLEVSDSTYLEQ